MDNSHERDYITVEDENGEEKQFSVEALFDIEGQTYAFLRSEENMNDTMIMEVENEENDQYLVGIMDPEKKEMLLDAYQIAVEANPAD